jgi:hypothetical protein
LADHAGELAGAGFFRRLTIWWKMMVKYRAARRLLIPSRKALFGKR